MTAPPLALVTGGAGLIGAQIATELAARGNHVIVADRDHEAALSAAQGIRAADGLATGVYLDVGDEDAVQRCFADVDDLDGQLEILVNCAAPISLALTERPLANLDIAVWDDMLRIALRGTMLACQDAVRRMAPAGRGSIVNVSSVHAFVGDVAMVAYPVAKAGILALTRSVATQYGRAGVRCNAVCPGTIAPPGMARADLDRRLRHQLIDRAGTPFDVAMAVAYLAGDDAAFITGQTFVIDGGLLCHLPSYADGGHVAN